MKAEIIFILGKECGSQSIVFVFVPLQAMACLRLLKKVEAFGSIARL